MKTTDKSAKERPVIQTEAMDYEVFLAENQKRINLLLNKFLWFSVLVGPALMLAIRFGIFHSVTYQTCIQVSLLLVVLSAIHYLMIRRGMNTTTGAVIAFFAIDILLILMNSAHIGIYITWFVVPLISLLFCDFKIYALAVVINYCMMTLSVWIVSPYYAGLRVDFNSPFEYFAGRMGGFTIETVIMVVAGYSLCRLTTSYYRELIEKYQRLNESLENIRKHEQKEEQLIQISMTDELTELPNRRSYDAAVESLQNQDLAADFVLFSMDVNGLKEANDTRGHAAGDEMLIGAAACLGEVFRSIGKVYRTGGDEFLAIANCALPEAVREEIGRRAAGWKGSFADRLSISVGYATHSEHPEADIHGLERLADAMMYREKNRYYSTPGIDRRRNPDSAER